VSLSWNRVGFRDDDAINEVAAFEKGMIAYFQTVGKPVWNDLDKSKALDGGMEKKLGDAIGAFKGTWKAS